VRTLVNVTIYSQYNNNNSDFKKDLIKEIYFALPFPPRRREGS
jgi:hypothetical protein